MERSAEALFIFAEIVGKAASDIQRIRITPPNSRTVVDRTPTIVQDRARWFGFAGLRRASRGWPPGEYVGSYTLSRPGNGGAVLLLQLERRVVLR